MGGAPTTPVIPADASNENAAGASNRSMSAMAPPVMRLAFITPVIPSTWDSGAAANCTSSAVIANASASARAFHAMPPWVSSAALASPVVPDVKMRTATSSSLRATTAGAAAPSSTPRPAGSTASTRVPRSPRLLASAGVVTKTAAPAASSRCLTSRGFSRMPSGAATAPAAGWRRTPRRTRGCSVAKSQRTVRRAAPAACKAPTHASICAAEIAIRDPSVSMEQRGPLRQTFARRLDETREVSVCVLHARPRARRRARPAPRHPRYQLT